EPAGPWNASAGVQACGDTRDALPRAPLESETCRFPCTPFRNRHARTRVPPSQLLNGTARPMRVRLTKIACKARKRCALAVTPDADASGREPGSSRGFVSADGSGSLVTVRASR